MKNLLSFDLIKLYKQAHTCDFVPTFKEVWTYFYCNTNKLRAYSSKQLANKLMKLTDDELVSAIQGMLSLDYYNSITTSSTGLQHEFHRKLPTIETVRHLLERTQKWIDENTAK